MYDVRGKLLGGIKSKFVDSLTCVRVKRDENEQFRINSGVRRGCIMSPLAYQCICECSDKGGEDGKEGSETYEEGDRMKITWPLVCR